MIHANIVGLGIANPPCAGGPAVNVIDFMRRDDRCPDCERSARAIVSCIESVGADLRGKRKRKP